MRGVADPERVRRFLRELGRRTRTAATLYLSGGATAVLHGWRTSTIDIDIRLEPDADDILRAIGELKEELEINVELASPIDFIPEPPGWRDRSPNVASAGVLTIRHMDPYAQALAKIERDHPLDKADVRAMLESGLIQTVELRRLYDAIEAELYRYPAIDAASFRSRLERTLAEARR
jgi:hypothetical protein